MPLLVISFGLQYYDKAILGSASIFGIIKDLGLVDVLSSASQALLGQELQVLTSSMRLAFD